MRYSKPVLFLLFLVVPIGTVFSTETTDYMNYMFFNSQMEHMRTTHERAILLNNNEVFSLITDIRYTDNSTGGLMSVMYGAGYVDSSITFGVYYLGYTSDLGFTMGVTVPGNGLYRDGFGASGIGLSLNLAIMLITFDWTFAFDKTFQYAKVYIPLLRSSVGFGFSPYENQVSIVDNKVINKAVYTGGSPRFNILKFDSAILQIIGLGLEYFTAKKTVNPIATFAVHNIIPQDDWEDMLFDAFFYVRPSVEVDLQSVKIVNFEARVKVWFYIPDTKLGGTGGNDLLGRTGMYCAFSIVQPSQDNTEYHGGSGLGLELGMGGAVLDNLNLGMKPDFFNISYFWNYSGYFNTYPGMSQGFRFLFYI
ncbi:MAG: hypothetical protein HPY53_04375 [Brevinematales bacterium]|nr:hypothetical protein [Brevinematales bacterium]